MKTRPVIVLSVVVLAGACSVNTESFEAFEPLITIEAIQEGHTASTKTTVQDGGEVVYWEPNDEVKVFYGSTGSRFVSNNTELVGVTKFTGTLSAIIGFNEGFSNDNPIWGLYPYRADASSDGGSVITTLPSEQIGRAGSFAKNTHISLGRSTSLSMGFYSVCGGLRFSLTQEGINKVVFSGNNKDVLAGIIKLSFESGVPKVEAVSDGVDTITLTAPDNGSFETGVWYYIEALPVTLTEGFTLSFFKGDKTAVKTSVASVTIKRGVFGSLANVDAGLVFTEGGEPPTPNSVIQFADPVAKYACVSKYDGNGDGEVSYAEAAAVTSLQGLFTDWNTVQSFEEIKYFINVTSTKDVFNDLPQLKRITIPANILELGRFSGCSSLEDVTILSELESMPEYCFHYCSKLKNVVLPNSLLSIPYGCFYCCTSLKSIVLPTCLQEISNSAFYGCSALETIDFPTTLTTIGSYAFQDCRSLTAISIDIPSISLASHMFKGCTGLIKAVLPSDLTVIPANCFSECTSLYDITWPSAPAIIGDYAFYNCPLLAPDSSESVVRLTDTVRQIGREAFNKVTHIIIPSLSVVSLGSRPFGSLSRIYVPSSLIEMYRVMSNWSVYEDQLFPIDAYPAQLRYFEPEAIDLGLPSGVKWGSWNLGAHKTEDNGFFFAWGEVEPKAIYTISTYKWSDGSINSFTKYNTNSKYGLVDNISVLADEDDAVKVHLGGIWRMPTEEDLTELRKYCTWTWSPGQNGETNGYTITSNIDGFADKSIFLPAAGYMNDYHVNGSLGCHYWTSSLYLSYPDRACCIGSYMENKNWALYYDRFYGLTIRPVCD